MKIDKISVVLLVGIAVCLALAFMLPATVPAMAGNVADQTATTLQASAILIKAQDGIADISGWTFTGIPGSTNSSPVNSNNELQNASVVGESVAVLNNTGPGTYKIILHANEFSDPDVASVDNELYYITSTLDAPGVSQINQNLAKNGDKDTGVQINGGNGMKSLWLKLTFGNSANKTAHSSFSVLGETP